MKAGERLNRLIGYMGRLVSARRRTRVYYARLARPWKAMAATTRIVLLSADAESRFTGGSALGTEHLLYGLVHVNAGGVAYLLGRSGADYRALAAEVRARPPASDGPAALGRMLDFTPDAVQAFRLARLSARQGGRELIAPADLLAGIATVGCGPAHRLLIKHGLDPERLAYEVRNLGSLPPTAPATPRGRPTPSSEIPMDTNSTSAETSPTSLTYAAAGVDIEAGERAVALMKDALRATHGPEVLTGLSDFGGMYALDPTLREPVLVSSTDGVGTKLKIAFALDKHDTVGQDLVGMCVDDVVVQGARPLFMLDYLAVGKLRPEVAADIVRGIAEACRQIPCALIGGETAELPGFYAEGEYDMAGFAVGVVERDRLIDGSQVRAGDVVLGLGASGLHSNGYSLARAVLLESAGLRLDQHLEDLGRTLGEELLEPTRVYAGPLGRLFTLDLYPHALAHITGGGIPGNLCRVIPDGLQARVRAGSWPILPVFPLIQRLGQVAEAEMYRTFNMGLGMMAVVAPDEAESLQRRLEREGEQVYIVGEIAPAEGELEKVVLA